MTLYRISPSAIPSDLILTAADFIAGFVPPEFLIEGLVQRAYCYSLTAPTGHGKTAVAILIAFRVATGGSLCDLEIEQGRVLYCAGENPDDIRARVLLAGESYGVSPGHENIHFTDGTFSISGAYAAISQKLEEIGGADLVIVDTSAAFFEGDDENNNVDAGAHARLLRSLKRYHLISNVFHAGMAI